VINDIQRTIARDVQLPEGYRVEYGGQFEAAAAAERTLFIASILAICVIYLLLYSEFKNLTLSAIVMLNLPLALIGGVLAVFFTSGIVSIPSIIGFITLFGIATRNGILLISRYKHLYENFDSGIALYELPQNTKFQNSKLQETILQGSMDRLNPILMTAISSALALMPLVIQGGKTGNEIQSPMAVVVLGGLLTSTFLNIYVVPVVYELFQRKHPKRGTEE
jgi:Cu/Ag efflux pump CusA